MPASPLTSAGYPFSKGWSFYNGEALGRAFFSDGLVAGISRLRIFDHARVLLAAANPASRVEYALLRHQGQEIPVYVFTSAQEADLADKCALLALLPTEAAVFALLRENGQVEFRRQLGKDLLSFSRFPDAAAVQRVRVVRPAGAVRGQRWSASRLLALFDLADKRLLDPQQAATLDEKVRADNPIGSHREQPKVPPRRVTPQYLAGRVRLGAQHRLPCRP